MAKDRSLARLSDIACASGQKGALVDLPAAACYRSRNLKRAKPSLATESSCSTGNRTSGIGTGNGECRHPEILFSGLKYRHL